VPTDEHDATQAVQLAAQIKVFPEYQPGAPVLSVRHS
jgi:hypothetical protein